MNCNMNFKGRLVIDGMTTDKERWQNISKIFKEETKGINYESRIFNDNDVLEIYTDKLSKKNGQYDYINDFETRETRLTKKGTKALMALSDSDIAKALAKNLQFTQKLDECHNLAEKTLDDAYSKVVKIFEKNGFNKKHIDTMFDEVSAYTLGYEKIVPEYKKFVNSPIFKDAEMSHMDYLG